MNKSSIILVFLTFVTIKHCLCDWILQTPYQYKNKGIYGHPGGIQHALIAAGGTLIALMTLAYCSVRTYFTTWYAFLQTGDVLVDVQVWFVLAVEAIFHYHVDWLKVYLNDKLQLSATGGPGYWNLIGIDQMFHALSYIWMAYVLFG